MLRNMVDVFKVGRNEIATRAASALRKSLSKIPVPFTTGAYSEDNYAGITLFFSCHLCKYLSTQKKL